MHIEHDFNSDGLMLVDYKHSLKCKIKNKGKYKNTVTHEKWNYYPTYGIH